MPSTVDELLVKQLDEAYAMKHTVAKLLDGMIRTTSDPAVERMAARIQRNWDRVVARSIAEEGARTA